MQRVIYLILAIVIGYGLLEALPLLRGPSLTIVTPLNHATYAEGIVPVTGRVARVALLTLNGATLLRDAEGNFSSTLTFPRGGSLLTFAATDQFGRRVSTTREIFIP